MKKYNLIFYFIFFININLTAQKNVTLTVKENQTIRSIANEFLGDSNLWEDILRANKITSPAEIKAGLKLIIPVESIKENQEILNAAIAAVNEASKAGAKVFAEDLITKANNLYEAALAKRKEGKREESTKLARQSKEKADKAIIVSNTKSNTAGTALLSYKKGDVENKKPAELIWNVAELYSLLYEQYRTRTLSNSYAEISFKDLSKIRLYENSQAVIQSSRVDLLKNQRKATVNLEKGEAYALLLGNGKKKDFNLNIPGLETKIDSKLFWVQKENKETKIANYSGEIAVTAQDSMVVIKENEGSVVPDGGVPSVPKSLLPSPGLLFPEFEKTFYVSTVDFKWLPIDDAVKYSFMVSKERTFDSVIESNKELINTEFTIKDLPEGIYYWRVAAIDEIGFPGPFSSNGFFIVREDNTPPYLIVKTPDDNIVTKENTVLVSGTTETGINLKINGTETEIDSNGIFSYNYLLNDGFNKINVTAVDLGNNETTITKNIIFESNPDVKISFTQGNIFDDNNNIVSNNKSIKIYGITRPKSVVKVFTKNDISLLKTLSNEEGKFEFLLSSLTQNNSYKLLVKTPAGYQGEKEFNVILNSKEPEIILNSIPKSTSVKNVSISGSLLNTDELYINKTLVIINETGFNYPLILNEGKNRVLLEARNLNGYSKTVDASIFLDTEAPALKYKGFKIETADNFEIIKIKIEVSDNSELKRTAEINYEINGEELKSYLRLDGNTQTYEGIIQILKSQRENYKLNFVVIEDYLGNKSTFNF